MRYLFIIVPLTLLGAACVRSERIPPAGDVSVTIEGTLTPSSEPGAAGTVEPNAENRVPSASGPSYDAYTAESFSRDKGTRPVLLYFYASWCPICRVEEPRVRDALLASGLDVSGFRVDFDREFALRQELRVPYQHHIVIFDSSGGEVARFSQPIGTDELISALKKAANGR